MAKLIQERVLIDGKLAKLKNTVEALSALCDEQATAPEIIALTAADESLGITDAIRKVMSASKLPMTAPQIRNSLLNMGYDVDQYASVLTVIHNTVRRLEKQGEIAEVKTSTGIFIGWMYRRPSEAMPPPPPPSSL